MIVSTSLVVMRNERENMQNTQYNVLYIKCSINGSYCYLSLTCILAAEVGLLWPDHGVCVGTIR